MKINDNFDIFHSLRQQGLKAVEAYLKAKERNYDYFYRIRMLRKIYELDLIEAKKVSIIAEDVVKLDTYEKNLIEATKMAYEDFTKSIIENIKFRDDTNTQIEDFHFFNQIGIYVDRLIQERNLKIKKIKWPGSFTWVFSGDYQSKYALMKLNHYKKNDYLWGMREEWAKKNNIWSNLVEICSYRFIVQPYPSKFFLGFPIKNDFDYERIRAAVNLIPKNFDL